MNQPLILDSIHPRQAIGRNSFRAVLAGAFVFMASWIGTGHSGMPGSGDPVVGMPDGIPTWGLYAGIRPAAQPGRLFELGVTVTAYSSTPGQTDSTPFLTANNSRVRPGIIALSRDLLRKYTPGAPFEFGDIVELEGIGRFQVEDTMARRFSRRADIWFESTRVALRWGKRETNLVKLTPETSKRGVWDGSIPLEHAISD